MSYFAKNPEEATALKEDLQPVPGSVGSVSADPEKLNISEKELLLKSFLEECAQMTVWYDQAPLKKSRVRVGVSGLSPVAAAEFLAAFFRFEFVSDGIGKISVAEGLRLAVEDLKDFYLAAVSAQSGLPYGSDSLGERFWVQTAAAKVIDEVRRISLKGESQEMQSLAERLLAFQS